MANNVLTPRRQRFAGLMATRTMSATKAYIASGYAPRSARVEACKAMKDPRVQQAIADKQQELRSGMASLPVEAFDLEAGSTALEQADRLRALAGAIGMLP